MTIRVLELTDCYKCSEPIMAVEGTVHPLCVRCQENFDEWFAKELSVFGN